MTTTTTVTLFDALKVGLPIALILSVAILLAFYSVSYSIERRRSRKSISSTGRVTPPIKGEALPVIVPVFEGDEVWGDLGVALRRGMTTLSSEVMLKLSLGDVEAVEEKLLQLSRLALLEEVLLEEQESTKEVVDPVLLSLLDRP